MSLIEIDGAVIDDETGEVMDLPAGSDRMGWLAARLIDAIEQERAWTRAVAALKTVFVKDQEERKAQYGDVVVSIRQSTRREFATEPFREWLADAQLDGGALLQLALAARAFDIGSIADNGLVAAVERYVVAKPTRPFAMAERVRKAGPRVREIAEALA